MFHPIFKAIVFIVDARTISAEDISMTSLYLVFVALEKRVIQTAQYREHTVGSLSSGMWCTMFMKIYAV